MRVRETTQASRNSIDHEMCDAGQRYESGDARGGETNSGNFCLGSAQPAVANNTGQQHRNLSLMHLATGALGKQPE